MYTDCVYYKRPHAHCLLGRCICNRALHMTCLYERVNPEQKRTKKEKNQDENGFYQSAHEG
jgi:hypothetical protein